MGILDIVSAFDWITPTVAFAQDFLNGPIADFGIPSNVGYGGWNLKRLLKQNGVKVWGVMLNPDGDTLMFTVREGQAKYTYHLLQQNGVPILYAPDNVVKPGRKWWDQ
jgi:hypothetical protein